MLCRQNGECLVIERMYDVINNDVLGGLIYGLDFIWIVWWQDMFDVLGICDGNIFLGVGLVDFVWLFGGMCRGGCNYYVFDVIGVNNVNLEIE